MLQYDLRDVVIRLRRARKRGLGGEELQELVLVEACRRQDEGRDDMYVGEEDSEILDVLTDVEIARLNEVRTAFRMTCFALGLDPALYQEKLHLHPGVLRYVLTADAAELPTERGWASWTRAFTTVNVPSADCTTNAHEAAA